MDLIEKFQELTGIAHKDIAEEILQQFDWNIESAVDCFLSDGKPIEPSPVASEVPLLDSQPRLLNFEIKLSLNDKNARATSLKDVPDSYTFGDLKRLYVNKCHPELTRLAENVNLPSDVGSLVGVLRFEGMRNQSHLDDNATLKSLHLPIWNSFTARLTKGLRNISCATVTTQGTSSSSFPLDLRVCLLGSPNRRNSGTHRRFTDSRPIRLKNITNDTNLADLKRSAAKELDIAVSNQVWSLPASSTPAFGLVSMVKDLNTSSNASCGYKLQRYNLKSNRYYVLELTDSQTPSLSQASSSSGRVTASEDNHRPQRSKKKIHYDISQELDDDPDFTIYSDIDDPNDEIALASSSSNPYSLPLIPLKLIGSPREALDNFYQVFCQRYCSNPGDSIPPFLLCPFNDIFTQYFSSPYAADRKPLFIYLHNDRSVAVHIFCNRLLCSQQMNQFMEANELKIWPWDVTLEAAKSNVLNWMQPRLEYLVTSINQLQVDQFPLLIMLCKLSGSYEVITILTGHGFSIPAFWPLSEDSDHAMEAFPSLEQASTPTTPGSSSVSSTRGKLDAEDIVSELWQKYVIYQERLQPEIEADSQRVDRELMRREQDRAYEESLEQDRFKVEARQREKEAVAQREEEARVEAEVAQREARNRQLSSIQALPPEPPASAEGVTTLRLRLPTSMPLPPSYEHLSDAEKYPIHNGMVTRRFRAQNTLRDLKNFIESLGYTVANFKLLTTFPRVDLTAHSSDNATLAELKLVPQETLILELR